MSSSGMGSSFVTIGEGIHLFNPTKLLSVNPSDPTIVLIFGWMGAKLPHLHKYSSVYREKYPNAIILLVRSEPSFFWTTEYHRRKALSPVVEILTTTGCIQPSHPTPDHESSIRQKILVHTFSNGGCFQLTTLGNILSANQATSSSSTPATSAIILDSCPGDLNFSSARRAFASAITNPLARFLTNILLIFYFCTQLIRRYLFRKQATFQLMKSNLNKPNVLPWMTKGTPRLYIYADGDEMVTSSRVEEHIEEAKRKGLIIHAQNFGKESKHVAHARTDPKKYWAAVEHVWKKALALEEKTT